MSRVRRVTTLGVSFPSAARLLRTSPREILTGSRPAEARFKVGIAGTDVSRPVRIVPGELEEVGPPLEAVVLPFQVQASEREGWFPVLSAELQLVPSGPSQTELALEGRYRVPGGALGMAADRAVLRGVAEQSIDGFFHEVAARLARHGRNGDALTGIPG